jgi:hypothetical protein
VPTAQPDYVPVRLDALHEAAHAVVAHHLGRPVLSIFLVPQFTRLGKVAADTPARQEGEAYLALLRAEALYWLSGHTADLLAGRKPSDRRGLVAQVMAESVIREIARRQGRAPDTDIPIIARYVGHVFEHWPEDGERYVCLWARETERLVLHLWPIIDAVAEPLFERKRLSGDEFRRIVEPWIARGELASHDAG